MQATNKKLKGIDLPLLKLEKPDSSKKIKHKSLTTYLKDPKKFIPFIRSVNEPKYLYWDKVKYKKIPEGVTPEMFWFIVKQTRILGSNSTPIKAESGELFVWFRQNIIDEYLHKIDFYTGGQMFAEYSIQRKVSRQKYIGRGILEEAIASSQIEGANTTRLKAKKMIIEKREPRNRSEIMIINNYATMKNIDEEYKSLEMSKKLLFQIHSDITKNDPEINESERNRYRKDKDEITFNNNEVIAHTPPKEKFMRKQMGYLIDYANDKDSDEFMHPIIKAIFLHFWIGYLHPFVDGNGRLARAVFYWYLLKKGYWSILFIPISTLIKKSRAQYDRAYIYSEQDDFDLTYFLDYHIRKLVEAIDEFQDYIENVKQENKLVEDKIDIEKNLNSRQKQFIYHLIEEGENSYSTITSYSIVNNVTRVTAGKDLKGLVSQGFLKTKKVGKFVRYYADEKLIKLIATI